MEYTTTTFTLGSSTVLTLPKPLGVTPGIRAIIKKMRSGFVIKFAQSKIDRDIALVKKLAGGMKSSSNMTPDEMNRVYDLGTYGK